MKYATLCSGIEACSAAWHPLGWEPVFFSEIEPFPKAVLKHHYPTVPDLGDMTQYHKWSDHELDLICAGTPCQAFSVAGLREGLRDPRGNLTLTFLGVLERYRPRWVVWENVPGVLSDRTNAFGNFLGGLGQLGYGFAYRVLDAQYFGVAQRRRRVFVVGHLGDWRPAAAVLFEPDCLRGNPAPSRETRKATAGGVEIGPSGGKYTDINPTLDTRAKDGPIRNQLAGAVLEPRYFEHHPAPSREKREGTAGGVKIGVDNFSPKIAETLMATDYKGFGHNRDHNMVLEPKYYEHHPADSRVNGPFDVANTVSARYGTGGGNTPMMAQPIPINTMTMQGRPSDDIKPRMGMGIGKEGDPAPTLTKGHSHAVAQPIALNIYGGNKRKGRPNGGFYVKLDEETSKTLDGFGGLNPTASQGGTAIMQPVAQPMAFDAYNQSLHPHTSQTLSSAASDINHTGGVLQPIPYDLFQITSPVNKQNRKPGDPCHTLARDNAAHASVNLGMVVRRLTPTECERLQGFPDGYTNIPWRGKPESPDGPRYKALGNSMAVPVMEWIGRRIKEIDAIL